MDKQYVNNIIKPEELFLMWKDINGSRHKVGVLTEETFTYLSAEAPEMIAAIESGFQGFPAFNMNKLEHKNPLPVFMRRCPPKDRRDFKQYLEAFSLDPESDSVKKMSDFTLLGYTGAYVPSNPFNLINPFSNQGGQFEFVMQVAGAHHNYFQKHPVDSKIKGKTLDIVKEPDNPYDPDAILLKLDNDDFGHVQRGLTSSFHEWMDNNRIQKIKISRINGSNDHPYAYAYVQISEAAVIANK